MSDLTINKSYDVVIIGAGHNGLVAAAYLAKAGQKVLVVEQRDSVGGAAGSAQIFPGFEVGIGAADGGLFNPQVAHELKLENHGLRWIESPAVVNLLQKDGSSLTLWRETREAAEEIAAHSENDAKMYPAYLRSVTRFAAVLEGMLLAVPPSLPEVQPGKLLPWLSSALKVKMLGDREMMEFLRVLPMPAADWLGEWFESEPLKAAIAASSVLGSAVGPMSSGTSFLLLYHATHAGQAGLRASRFVQGGVGRLSEALASAARLYGAEILTGQPASSVVLEDGKAAGVLLADGRQFKARAVVSNADPRRTFFDLVGAANLPVSFVREIKNIRMRSSMARVSLALQRLPNFPGAGAVSYTHLTLPTTPYV
jgi:phytoene dehydrogenase-like protein